MKKFIFLFELFIILIIYFFIIYLVFITIKINVIVKCFFIVFFSFFYYIVGSNFDLEYFKKYKDYFPSYLTMIFGFLFFLPARRIKYLLKEIFKK